MSSAGGTLASTARSFWIYFWIYTGLVLGALASVSANIAYTYIPPRNQPAWWPRSRLWDPAAYIPPPGDVAVAVFCPVAIFILTEVITRPRWREGKLSFAVRTISAVMVGLPVAVASYLHLCALLEYYSTIPFIAYTLPLTVDGLMLACTAALQLTGVPVLKDQAEQKGDPTSLTDEVTVLPRPRASIDNTARNLFDVQASVATAPITQRTAAPTTEGLEPPPVGQLHAPVSQKRAAERGTASPLPPPVGTETEHRELVAPPVGTEGQHREPVAPPVGQPRPPVEASPALVPPPVGTEAQHPESMAPPVGFLGPPMDADLLPLVLVEPPVASPVLGLRPPVAAEATGGIAQNVPPPTGGAAAEPNNCDSPPPLGPRPVGVKLTVPPVGLLGPPVGGKCPTLEPPGPPVGPHVKAPEGAGPTGGPGQSVPQFTGGPPPESDRLAAKRSVPVGRLGAADLADIEIIRLAVADNPLGKITGTALRKDFGVGPGRAARIRDEIRKRRGAARLAAGIRERIEQLDSADAGAAPASKSSDEQPTSPVPTDMGDTIKASPELFRQGP